jgi:hypothetical protein
MTAAMAWQEHQIDTLEGAGQKLVGRLAPRAFDGLPAGIFQPINVINAGATDYPENGFGHVFSRVAGLRGVLTHP